MPIAFGVDHGLAFLHRTSATIAQIVSMIAMGIVPARNAYSADDKQAMAKINIQVRDLRSRAYEINMRVTEAKPKRVRESIIARLGIDNVRGFDTITSGAWYLDKKGRRLESITNN